MSGIVFRIAIKMGYHRDGEQLQLTAFETEMRRRIWWHIVMQDNRSAHISGLSTTLDYGPFDTKLPSNLNDADLFPGSVEPVHPREGPTEMAFCLVSHSFSKFMFVGEGRKRLETALFTKGLGEGGDERTQAQEAEDLEEHKSVLRQIIKELTTLEERYVDASAGPTHKAALMFRPVLVQKMESTMMPVREQPEWGTEIFGAKDNLFKVIVSSLENSFEAYDLMMSLGFLWFCKIYFELAIFKLLTMQLYQRPMGSLSDRGWANVEKVYYYHEELLEVSNRHYATQAQLTVKAWQVREQAYASIGKPIDKVPDVITKLRALLPQARGSQSSPPIPDPSAATSAQAEPQFQDLDPILSDFIDLPFPEEPWDMEQSWNYDPVADFDGTLNL